MSNYYYYYNYHLCSFNIFLIITIITIIIDSDKFYGVNGQILTSPIIRSEHDPPKGLFNSTTNYIEHFGYTAEHHNIISEDGYLISVYRIPGDGLPIILQHGLMMASDSWVIQGPRYDLAFMLADNGRDVWIPDTRGNVYSRSHLKLSSKQPKFWNFSFHETGYYDLPAIVNYILQLTKSNQLDFVGHSLGGLAPLLMCATKPEMNTKLRSIFALAPAVFYNTTFDTYIESVLFTFSPYMRYLNSKFGVYEFFPRSEAGFRFLRLICSKKESTLYSICLRFMKIVLGVSIERPHDKTWLEYALVSATGVSYKNFVHLEQIMRSGRLTYFNYGSKRNQKLYGTKYPPEYDLSLVTVPVVLIYGDGDTYVYSEDVNLLSKKLPNVIANYRIDRNRIDFNHNDFVWGNEAKPFVYDFIFDVLNYFDRQLPSISNNNFPPGSEGGINYFTPKPDLAYYSAADFRTNKNSL